ncbi:Leucine-Rich Repeat, Immunoglobulin-Like Domain And Transmembrane Domain-Containing Protein 1 [Manis pentadactyla]|nr:Leucine-Rich Repeat, Immunoglobulin-Like Domain And Transmembrane Domain-Containing Protein 1 [Manis pentadactyla]
MVGGRPDALSSRRGCGGSRALAGSRRQARQVEGEKQPAARLHRSAVLMGER